MSFPVAHIKRKHKNSDGITYTIEAQALCGTWYPPITTDDVSQVNCKRCLNWLDSRPNYKKRYEEKSK